MGNQFEKYSLYVKENGKIVDVNRGVFNNCDEAFELFQSLYDTHYGSININENLVDIHTGGWSDNEALISDFKETFWWNRYHKITLSGGHYYFQLEGENEWEIKPKN